MMILDFGFFEAFLAIIKATRKSKYSKKLQTPLINLNVFPNLASLELL